MSQWRPSVTNTKRYIARQASRLITNTIPEVVRKIPTVFGKELSGSAVEMAQPLLPAAKLFVRVAGVSGLLAVGLGAYGAHGLRETEGIPPKRIATFETGNRYHFMHTLALLAVPMTRKPMLVGSLLSAGMLLFCGSCYVNSLTGYDPIRQVTPYGGMLLMLGWAAMAL